MKFTSPSGKTYEWTAPTPPTQADIDALVASEGGNAAAPQAAPVAVPAPQENRAHTPEPGTVNPLKTDKIDWPGEWAKAQTPADGLKLVAKWMGEHKGAIADFAAMGVLPAIGQEFGGPVGGAVLGAVGDAIGQVRRMSYENQRDFNTGEIAGSAIAGAVPIKGIAGGGGFGDVVKQGVKAGLGNTAAVTAESLINRGELPSEEQARTALNYGAMGAAMALKADTGSRAAANAAKAGREARRVETYELWRKVGGVLDPEISNPGVTNKAVTALAANSQYQNQAKVRNQSIVTNVVRDEIGMPQNAPISPESFIQMRYEAAAPYREVSRLNANAAEAVKDWVAQRGEARNYWKQYGRNGLDTTRDKAIAAEELVNKAEATIDNEVAAAGATAKGLKRDLEEAKVRLAKMHVAESAFNVGTGNFSAPVIHAMGENGVKLSDGLDVISRMYAAMPQVMGEVEKASAAAKFARTAVYMGAGTAGAAMAGPGGAVAGVAAVHAIPAMIRRAALSEPYQQFMGIPKYGVNNPDVPASILRFASQSAGR